MTETQPDQFTLRRLFMERSQLRTPNEERPACTSPILRILRTGTRLSKTISNSYPAISTFLSFLSVYLVASFSPADRFSMHGEEYGHCQCISSMESSGGGAVLGEGLWSSHCIWGTGSDDWPSWHHWPNSVAWEKRKGQGGLLEKVSMGVGAGHTRLWLPSPAL